MGRRELLIIVGFFAVGSLLYWWTAPPPAESSGFSLRRLVDEIRADIRSDASDASFTHTGSIVPSALVADIRLSGVTGNITVAGEERDDIGFELTVHSTGPDEATATDYAKRTLLVEDDLGDTLGLRVSYPPEARQRTEIVLRLPRRLGLRLEGDNSSDVNDLAFLRLEGTVGETTATRIEGEVGGSHRNGRLTVTGAGSVSLTLQQSRARFAKIAGGLAINATRGETHIVGSRGPIAIEQSNNELRIEEHDGVIRVGGSGGQVEIVSPQREVEIDVRRAEVEVVVTRAVAMTVITTDEPLRLVLDGTPAITLDALIAGSGEIDAADVGLTATTGRDQISLTHAFADPAPARVVLRNRRDDIVIRRRK